MPLSPKKSRKSSLPRPKQARQRHAYVIQPDGTVFERLPHNGKVFTLVELQNIVGGFIEIVALADGSEMVLNDEGKLLGLPYNEKATLLFNAGGRVWFDPIVGTVLVCSASCL